MSDTLKLKAPSLSVTSALGRGTMSAEDSPGSSIFDLPVHQEDTPTIERRTHVFPFPPPSSSASGTKCVEDQTSSRIVNTDKKEPTYLVLSGGTGCNSIVSAFGDACYVLPVSDDGGSSSEIIRVLGGPSIGEYLVFHLKFWNTTKRLEFTNLLL